MIGLLLGAAPLAAQWWTWAVIAERLKLDPAESPWWYLAGFAGMGLFSSRFIIQWIHSERQRDSVIPVSFWYLSIAGSLITLVYAVHRCDPVFVLMYVFNCMIYGRNLYFIFLRRRLAPAGGPSPHRPGRHHGGADRAQPHSGPAKNQAIGPRPPGAVE